MIILHVCDCHTHIHMHTHTHKHMCMYTLNAHHTHAIHAHMHMLLHLGHCKHIRRHERLDHVINSTGEVHTRLQAGKEEKEDYLKAAWFTGPPHTSQNNHLLLYPSLWLLVLGPSSQVLHYILCTTCFNVSSVWQ